MYLLEKKNSSECGNLLSNITENEILTYYNIISKIFILCNIIFS